MIAYRMHDKTRGVSDLLDPEQQYSFPMDGDDEKVRHGVSGVETQAGLAAYLAGSGVMADVPCLVRIEGPESEDTPNDVEFGEVLLLPEKAEIIQDDNLFFETVSALVDAYWEEGLTDIDELTERAEALGL